MARRQQNIKTFAPKRSTIITDLDGNESTLRKTVWEPAPSIHTLTSKVDHLEERLDHLEGIISQHTDLTLKKQEHEEVVRSRKELEETRVQLAEAQRRLQQCEAELLDAHNSLDNLNNQTAADRERIQALEAEKKGLNQLVKDVEDKLNESTKKVKAMESKMSKMESDLKDTNTKVAMMEKQMLEMKQQMDSFKAASSSSFPATERSTSVSSKGQPQRDDRGPASQRQTIGSLGLPPIALPPGGGGRSARGGNYNFPPK
ncbi:uncharacterized protein LOC143281747 [Babylonia areolata]|uniref:uncharacterized protein LOC143281747 n=1 Tax=Babylonia areolata TaxID=304850 RepID=UPI003FCF3565